MGFGEVGVLVVVREVEDGVMSMETILSRRFSLEVVI